MLTGRLTHRLSCAALPRSQGRTGRVVPAADIGEVPGLTRDPGGSRAAVAADQAVSNRGVEDPAELERVLRKAVAHDGPMLVDVIAEPLQDAAAPVSEWVA